MRSLRRIPAAIAISACARSPALDGDLERGAARVDRVAGAAELDQQPAARHQQGEARRLVGGERQAALGQRERGAVAKLLATASLGGQVGGGGARIVGAVEVLGGEDQVARREPLGGARVQDAAPLVQERPVGAVADERVAEHELAAVGADQEILDQQPAVVGRVARSDGAAPRP